MMVWVCTGAGMHYELVVVSAWDPKDQFLKHVTRLNNATTRPIWVRPDQLISHPSGSVGTSGRLSGTRGDLCSDGFTISGEILVGAYRSAGAL